MTSLPMPHYEVFRKNGTRWGRLLSSYAVKTPITGYSRTLDTGTFRCILISDGTLTIYTNSEWDFGTSVAVQDMAMIAASLIHDAFCHLTDRGIVPFSVRAKADNYFASMLWSHGSKGPLSAMSIAWRWTAVTSYSQLIARFKR